MLKKLLIIFIFFTLFINNKLNINAQSCSVDWSFTESLDWFPCWAEHGCSSVQTGGYINTDCGKDGVNYGTRERLSGNNCCAGGGGSVQNGLIVLHSSSTGENVRYTEFGCPNGQTGVSISSAENASGRQWVCDDNGGHLQFNSSPGENISFTVAVANSVAAHTECHWEIGNSNQSGVDDTTDDLCSFTYEGGTSNWGNGVTIRLYNFPEVPPPVPLPCPSILNYQCLPNGTQVQLSWDAVLGATNYGVYLNYLPDNQWVGPNDYWNWPLPTSPTNRTYNIIPGAQYSWNVQATDANSTGSSSACASNSRQFTCPANQIACGATPCIGNGSNQGSCSSGLICDLNHMVNGIPTAMCVIPACVGESCTCTNTNQTYCGDNVWQPQNQAGTGGTNNTGDEECDEDTSKCQMATSPSNGANRCTWTYCGDGIPQSLNGDEQIEQCDNGIYHPVTNPNGNRDESACDTSCRTRVNLSGSVHVGDGNASMPPGGICSGIEIGNPDPEFVPGGNEIIIEGQNLPGNIKTVDLTDLGTFSTWILPNSLDPKVQVGPPATIGSYTVQCTNAPPPKQGWYRGPNEVARNQSGVKFYYFNNGTTGTENAWFQTRSGLVYSRGTITSLIPSTCTGACESFFSMKVGSNLLSAGITWVGDNSELDLGSNTAAKPADRLVQNQKIENSNHQFDVESYEFFARKFNLDNVTDLPSDTITSKPINCTLVGDVNICKNTAETTTINLTTTPWNVTGTEKMIIFIDGDLVIEDNIVGTDSIINVDNTAFLSFIVNGSITFAPSVGNESVASANPNVEGVFVAKSILVEKATSGTDKRFVGEGSFISNDAAGSITLRRNIETDNNDTPAELFIHRPDFVINLPEKLKNYTLDWQEVN